MIKRILIFLVIILLSSGCTPKTVEVIQTVQVPVDKLITVEVTREIPVAQTVEVKQTVEVINTVENTIEVTVVKVLTQIVEKEVTREVVVTATPKGFKPQPTKYAAPPTPWAFKDVGEITANNVVMKLTMVGCMSKTDAVTLVPQIDQIEEFSNSSYICLFYITLTNNNTQPVTYMYDDVYFVVGQYQFKLGLCRYCAVGLDSYDALQPGVSGDITFVTGFDILPDQFPIRVMITLGRLFNPETYSNVTNSMKIEATVP